MGRPVKPVKGKLPRKTLNGTPRLQAAVNTAQLPASLKLSLLLDDTSTTSEPTSGLQHGDATEETDQSDKEWVADGESGQGEGR